MALPQTDTTTDTTVLASVTNNETFNQNNLKDIIQLHKKTQVNVQRYAQHKQVTNKAKPLLSYYFPKCLALNLTGHQNKIQRCE